MKCPTCVEAGQRSIVRAGRGNGQDHLPSLPSIDMSQPVDVYYDEDGRSHIHDSNRIVRFFHCSKGHEWKKTDILTCLSCSWPEASEPGAAAPEACDICKASLSTLPWITLSSLPGEPTICTRCYELGSYAGAYLADLMFRIFDFSKPFPKDYQSVPFALAQIGKRFQKPGSAGEKEGRAREESTATHADKEKGQPDRGRSRRGRRG